MVALYQCIVGKPLSIQDNCISMDENEKVVFIQKNWSFDLNGHKKLAKFRVFIQKWNMK